MPVGIYLYELDESFGPKVLADFYISKDKLTPEALKSLSDKHAKDLVDATYKTEEYRFYSSKITSEELKDGKFFLGFMLRRGEDLVSLKSVFENIESKIASDFTKDRKKLQGILKDTLTSILSLMEKIKEPKIIQEKINEKTKELLDSGKLQEAKDLIELGEKIPGKLSAEVKKAENYLKSRNYKKARKSYLESAELAEEINEDEMVEFLRNKADQVEKIPEVMKKIEGHVKDINKIADDIEDNELILYNHLLEPVENIINLSSGFEDDERFELLTELQFYAKKAYDEAKKLSQTDKSLRDIIRQL